MPQAPTIKSLPRAFRVRRAVEGARVGVRRGRRPLRAGARVVTGVLERSTASAGSTTISRRRRSAPTDATGAIGPSCWPSSASRTPGAAAQTGWCAPMPGAPPQGARAKPSGGPSSPTSSAAAPPAPASRRGATMAVPAPLAALPLVHAGVPLRRSWVRKLCNVPKGL
jgi:hypothetical protein